MEEGSLTGEECTITAIRTANAIPGKISEAVMWRKEVAQIAERLTGKKLTMFVSFGGATGGMAWTWQFDNAGQVEDALSSSWRIVNT